MQQLQVIAEVLVRQVENEHRDLFGVVTFKSDEGDTSRGPGRPTEIIWVIGEAPPAFPDKDRLIVIEGHELALYRWGVLKLTMEHMADAATGDIEFLDCLDWILDDDTGGLTFHDCCLATVIDGERVEPEAMRGWLLYQNRARIRELKQKAKEGAFDSFFRML